MNGKLFVDLQIEDFNSDKEDEDISLNVLLSDDTNKLLTELKLDTNKEKMQFLSKLMLDVTDNITEE